MDKQLTKEEIIKKHYELVFSSQQYDKSVNKEMNKLYFIPAMDEFANQEKRIEAIAYGNWIIRKFFLPDAKELNVNTEKEDNDLYDSFLNHQSKINTNG